MAISADALLRLIRQSSLQQQPAFQTLDKLKQDHTNTPKGEDISIPPRYRGGGTVRVPYSFLRRPAIHAEEGYISEKGDSSDFGYDSAEIEPPDITGGDYNPPEGNVGPNELANPPEHPNFPEGGGGPPEGGGGPPEGGGTGPPSGGGSGGGGGGGDGGGGGGGGGFPHGREPGIGPPPRGFHQFPLGGTAGPHHMGGPHLGGPRIAPRVGPDVPRIPLRIGPAMQGGGVTGSDQIQAYLQNLFSPQASAEGHQPARGAMTGRQAMAPDATFQYGGMSQRQRQMAYQRLMDELQPQGYQEGGTTESEVREHGAQVVPRQSAQNVALVGMRPQAPRVPEYLRNWDMRPAVNAPFDYSHVAQFYGGQNLPQMNMLTDRIMSVPSRDRYGEPIPPQWAEPTPIPYDQSIPITQNDLNQAISFEGGGVTDEVPTLPPQMIYAPEQRPRPTPTPIPFPTPDPTHWLHQWKRDNQMGAFDLGFQGGGVTYPGIMLDQAGLPTLSGSQAPQQQASNVAGEPSKKRQAPQQPQQQGPKHYEFGPADFFYSAPLMRRVMEQQAAQAMQEKAQQPNVAAKDGGVIPKEFMRWLAGGGVIDKFTPDHHLMFALGQKYALSPKQTAKRLKDSANLMPP